MSTPLDAAVLLRRDRFIVLASAAVVAGLAWLWMARAHGSHDHAHGAGFDAGLDAVAAASVMWLVMMVAMMLPPVMPWIVLFTSGSRERAPAQAPLLPAGAFVAGYFAVWAGYSLLAGLAQVGLRQGALLGGVELRAEPRLAAAILVTAGLFQLSPWKAACLRHCRSPLGFFLSRWRDGPRGAFGMGFEHGRYCVACCWALMAVSFALGVMSLLWMAALTLLLCFEKIAPGGIWLGRAAGVAMALWGATLLL